VLLLYAVLVLSHRPQSVRARRASLALTLLSLFGHELGSLPLALRALVISGLLVTLMINLDARLERGAHTLARQGLTFRP